MEPIRLVQTKDYIADLLREQILNGDMEDGEEIAQEALAESLHVSRIPVREAFQVLEQEGLMERMPNRHMRVTGCSESDVRQIFRVLAALETELLHLLIDGRADFAGVLSTFEAYRQQSLAGHSNECIQKQYDFHVSISNALGQRYLTKIHHKTLSGYFLFFIKRTSLDHSVVLCKLEKIVTALQQGEVQAVENAVKEYYDLIMNDIVKVIKHE